MEKHLELLKFSFHFSAFIVIELQPESYKLVNYSVCKMLCKWCLLINVYWLRSVYEMLTYFHLFPEEAMFPDHFDV